MANVNNNPQGSQQYSSAYIAAKATKNPNNLMWYFCCRNPSATYAWIKQNYPQYQSVPNGYLQSDETIINMWQFLTQTYAALPQAQQAHWITSYTTSMPAIAELNNWTNPKN